MTDDIEQRLAEAAEELREHEVTSQRLAELQERVDEMMAQVAEVRALTSDEDADVERLETRSFSRVLVSLLGTRDERLGRERAEADAAHYRLMEAETRLDAVAREHQAAQARLTELRAAPATHAAVLEEKERHLAGSDDPRARRILDIADERGRLTGDLREVAEAVDAACGAWEALSQLYDKLGDAMGPSVLDAFFGTSAPTSETKHALLDEAAQAATHAAGRLAMLRTELLDVPDPTLTAPQLAAEAVTRFAEVWFDNIFTDLAVHHRIKKARQGIEECMRRTTDVVDRLEQRAARGRETLAAIEAERHDLLTAPGAVPSE
ncbi:MAG: hypothetical protein WCA46_19240 [Actinocatenispora sp.]